MALLMLPTSVLNFLRRSTVSVRNGVSHFQNCYHFHALMARSCLVDDLRLRVVVPRALPRAVKQHCVAQLAAGADACFC